MKTGSFTQDALGRWYVNVQCDVADAVEPVGHLALGIDLGLTHPIPCADGVHYSRANLTRHYAKALALAQRAHKKKRVKAIHARIAHVRKDWTHHVTTAVARRAKRIVIGDVSSTTLVKTRFAQSTYDAAWGLVRSQLHYKAVRLAGDCVDGNERFSSVTCADCGARSGPRGLSGLGVRTWVCNCCGVMHERDVNAARNILAFRSGRATPSKGIPGL